MQATQAMLAMLAMQSIENAETLTPATGSVIEANDAEAFHAAKGVPILFHLRMDTCYNFQSNQ